MRIGQREEAPNRKIAVQRAYKYTLKGGLYIAEYEGDKSYVKRVK